jgi:hypothetical protein
MARFLTTGSIPAKPEYVVHLGKIFEKHLKNREMTSSKNQPFSCQFTMDSGNCTPPTGVQGIYIYLPYLQGERTVEPMP